MENLTFGCWVFGEDTDKIFSVLVPAKPTGATVDDLKTAIKDKIPVTFRNVDAKDINLYPILDDEHLEDELTQWTLAGKQRLSPRTKLSRCFPSDGQWLIIVNATLNLTCWVQGEKIRTLFPVEVPSDATVAVLAKAVKAERQDKFDAIPAVMIELYQVSLTPDELEETADYIGSAEPLFPTSTVSDVFPQPRKRCVHIIVGDPFPARRTTSRLVGEESDVLVELAKTFQRTTTISKSLTPSKAAKSSEYAKIQAGSQYILDCRFSAIEPINTVAPPIQLFNPAFAFFSGKAFDPAYVVPDDFVCDIHKLVAESAPIYGKEKHRQEKIRPILSKVIQSVISSTVNSDKTAPDFVVQTQHEGLLSYLVVAEEKNEFGDGGSDPSVQASFSYLRLISLPESQESCRRSCCPAFIIALAGPWLSIMGGIVVGRCVVQRLTDYIWVPCHSTHDDSQCLRIARVLYALRESIKILDSWYKRLDVAVPPYDLTPVFHPRFWPSPIAYREHGTNTLVEFTYQKPLEDDATCVTYLARSREDNPEDIVVKFVTSYGAEAHKHMASKGFAPRLLYCGEISVAPDMPPYGDLRMVVMEYVKGCTLHSASELQTIPSCFKSDLKRAFKHLHDGGYVFGDLRMPNIMVLPEGTSVSTAQLIDFDWAGKEGEVKYPISINLSTIAWPDGVKELAYIKKKHDDVMLASLMLDLPQ